MIKENQKFLNFSLVVIDVLVIGLALLCSLWLRFKTTLFGPIGGHLGSLSYLLFFTFAVIPVYLILYFFSGYVNSFCCEICEIVIVGAGIARP